MGFRVTVNVPVGPLYNMVKNNEGTHERNDGFGMDALVIVCSCNRNELWFGHGCFGLCMLLEHERTYGLGTHALVTVHSWNTNGILV